VSWQIVPTALPDYVGGSALDGAQRATQAMLEMKKPDSATLKRACGGSDAA
jgi:predicted 3-demethylubiquinone-9 3-methyltransferase (glyoxalase superfamily)